MIAFGPMVVEAAKLRPEKAKYSTTAFGPMVLTVKMQSWCLIGAALPTGQLQTDA